MKTTFRPTAFLEFEIDDPSPKGVFKKLAQLSETFGVAACGHCKAKEIYFKVREVDGNSFPEMQCRKCHYRLSFGQSKDGQSIYPRLRYHKQHPLVKSKEVAEGDYIADNGWEKPFRADDSQE